MNDRRIVYAMALASLALLGFGLTGLADEPDLAAELPRIKGLSPDEAIRSFRIHEGFQIVPAAVEPLVTDPVAMVYDADRAAYVVEMRGYPYPEKQPSGGVVRLVDVDGDGRFDRRTVFVDRLSWPTGIVPYDGGMFIAVAPDILYAKDTDGDGVADIRRTVFTGFGTQNVQGLVNGLLWGVDGWIYGSSGGNGGEIRNPAWPAGQVVSVRGRDFRFRPDGSKFEAISGGGQFGHCLDDWGHRFVCNNSNHIRQIILPSGAIGRNPALTPAGVLDDIAVEGGASPVFRISPAEPWRVVRTRQRKADPAMVKRLPPTELFAAGFFTSATGVTIYRGSAYPPEYRGNAFIGDVGGNLVHRKVVAPNGSIFKATRADAGVEFLASTDNWFRPVNFANTPDGTLMILDMYRETIEHPASIPEPIKKHLDLTSGKDRGRLYEILPEGFRRRIRPRLSTATTGELINHLGDPDAWWRETAQRLLIERGDAHAFEGLNRMVKEGTTPLARTHALWTRDAMGGAPADVLLTAMKDTDPHVREAAVEVVGRSWKGPFPHPGVIVGLANDPDPMVRFQAAIALGGVKGSEAVKALATIAEADLGDAWVRPAVLSSVSGRADALLKTLMGLDRKGGKLATPAGKPWLDDLAFLIGAENAPGQVADVLSTYLRPEVDPAIARAIVLGIGRGLRRSGGSIRDAVAQVGTIQPYFDRAAVLARGRGTIRERIEAAELLGLAPIRQALDVLPPLLDAREPTGVQLAAIQALNGIADPGVGPAIVGRWSALSPAVRREAIEALFARSERLPALLDGLAAKSIAASDLDPARRATLLANPRPAVRERAGRVLGAVTRGDRAGVIKAFLAAKDLDGRTDKGRAVFKQVCATCHRAETVGVDVGPNLATVTNRSAEDLIVHILDPNREVAANYVNYSVATADGRVVTGLIVDESANALTLRRAEGATDVIPRDRIEQVVSSGQSLMPEGLEKGLTPQDLADLIAFLKGIQAAPPR